MYAGGAVALLLDAAGTRAAGAWLIRIGAAACVLSGVRLTACMLATMIGDPRYIAEKYLRENVRPGDVIEVYGNNVYFPRFPEGARVERIGPNPTTARSPMPNIVEKQDRLGAIAERNPRFVVVSTGYAWRFMQRPPSEAASANPTRRFSGSREHTASCGTWTAKPTWHRSRTV